VRPPRRSAALLVAASTLVLTTAACGSNGGAAQVAPPKVALFEDLSVPDTLDTVLPASMALQAFLRSQTDAGDAPSFQVVPFDTGGDAATALDAARAVAADPTFVAAVAAPFWVEPASVADALGAAGVPVLNLSAAGRRPGSGPWRTFVADLGAQAGAAAALASREAGSAGLCEAGDGTAWSNLLAAAVRAAAPAATFRQVPDASDAANLRGCGAVLWTGFAPGAAPVRAALPPSVPLVGTDGMKTWSYLTGIPDGTSSFVACSCVDVTTSTRPSDMTFINRYQVATGLTPGVGAAEAWEAAELLAAALRGAGGRIAVAAGLTDNGGSPEALPHDFRGAGSRWIALDGAATSELP